jgi:outer membrane protein OmpA-like peptidoglycan-associated protein
MMKKILCKVGASLGLAAALGGCAPQMTKLEREVASRDVPTAMFVFFEKDSAVPVDGSELVFDQTAAVLGVFDNIGVKVVGHKARDEHKKIEGFPLDEARVRIVMGNLSERGVADKVVSAISQGNKESMAAAAGGDAAVDRRGELIFGLLPGS